MDLPEEVQLRKTRGNPVVQSNKRATVAQIVENVNAGSNRMVRIQSASQLCKEPQTSQGAHTDLCPQPSAYNWYVA